MLSNSGVSNNCRSPEFQSMLENVKFPQTTPADIIYGSKTTIHQLDTRGEYLHYHGHSYLGESKQQPVTFSSHVDENNRQVINKANTDEVNRFEYIKNGDIVPLTHVGTKRRLYTHDI